MSCCITLLFFLSSFWVGNMKLLSSSCIPFLHHYYIRDNGPICSRDQLKIATNLLFLSSFRIVHTNLSSNSCIPFLHHYIRDNGPICPREQLKITTNLLFLSSFQIVHTKLSSSSCIAFLFLLSSFVIKTHQSMCFCIAFSLPFFGNYFRARMGARVLLSYSVSFLFFLPLNAGIFSLVSFSLLG